MHETAIFSPAIFRFLADLSAHNERAWFQANKERYERDARQPALQFIVAFGPLLGLISPHFEADPRPAGGSLFRIHRDVRFSRDKSPYKEHIGIPYDEPFDDDIEPFLPGLHPVSTHFLYRRFWLAGGRNGHHVLNHAYLGCR